MKQTDFLTLIAASLLALLFVIGWAVVARAQQCPPKQYECRQVKAAVDQFGEAALIALARACGWTEEEIAMARRCLK